MELLETMLSRRSIRLYTGEKIPEEKLTLILKAGLASPSSRNLMPWEFILVQNKETIQAISSARDQGTEQLKNADAVIVVLGNHQLSDVWVEDCSIAMSNMLLMAHSLGIGACWVQGRLRKKENGLSAESVVRELLSIPECLSLLAFLSLGISAQTLPPHTEEELLFEHVHRETF